jgi:hypothetical protein
MRTMTAPCQSSRWFVVILTGLLFLGPLAAPAVAAEPSPPHSATALPGALFGGMMDNVLGNRQRMIQFAFVGFGIGVLILVTATRKH